jgi:hypothetical protein
MLLFFFAPSLGLPDFTSLHRDKLLAQNNTYKKEQHFHATLFLLPLLEKVTILMR